MAHREPRDPDSPHSNISLAEVVQQADDTDRAPNAEPRTLDMPAAGCIGRVCAVVCDVYRIREFVALDDSVWRHGRGNVLDISLAM